MLASTQRKDTTRFKPSATRVPPAPVAACKFTAAHGQAVATFQTTGPRLDYFCTAAPIAPCEFIAACRPGAKNPMWLSEPVATSGKILPPRRKFEAWAASLGRISRAGLKHLNSHLRISHRLQELRATYKFKTRSPFRPIRCSENSHAPPTPRRNSEAWASSLCKTFRAGLNGHL